MARGTGLAMAACGALALLPLMLSAAPAGPVPDGLDGEVVCEDGVCRIVPRSDSALGGAGGGSKLFPGYAVAANGMGERSAEEMVALLEGRGETLSGQDAPSDTSDEIDGGGTGRQSPWYRFAVAFFGGMLLNLTPCVLPMVPVTLMVLGIGFGKRGTARHPLWTGIAYGGGIAVAYGALGVVSLAAGTAFGSLQSSPWFNAAVGVAMGTITST